ncbi:MAG: gluconate 2-dehydrogenase subunit 3 family protein [Cytophagaceae bacterium]|nr:gluconate 2-dehydrogenase subunit 3 family protein [Cytophagaceae bacterium]MBK9935653.1 gluconate 2-dehydrogenase subunit 3 family protein [Cytophagaceae bacterium]MBL0302096.1 gluconate 2-dehydrogenase subunit 3 family protein [Cytophagaceae bacterium]MBL0324917.1 gluconate 2-dehydrogenase subunit 3 family protein [Cytophagaceae bacterium]
MKRREVFSSLTLGIVGAVSLPSWANNWTAKNLKPDSLELNTSEEDLLEAICEAIIPETDTPGSRTLQIPKFVKLMVTDMHKVADQDKFKKGLAKVNELSISLFGKSFEGSNTQQKLHLLQGFGMSSDENLRFFMDATKRYAVRAYTTSEYYQVNIEKFEFAPARYHGCVPLNQ